MTLSPEDLLALFDVAAAAQRGALATLGSVERRDRTDRPGQYRLDLVADAVILPVLATAGVRVLSEESGWSGPDDAPVTVVVDPVDGSTNCSRQLPYWAISLCALDHDGPWCALVQNGATGARYTAVRGEGAYLDVSIVEGVLSLTSLYIDEYLATGEVPGPGHNILTGRFACYDTYEAADGRWLAVAALEPRFFANLCAALGRPELAPLEPTMAAVGVVRWGDLHRGVAGDRRHLYHPGPVVGEQTRGAGGRPDRGQVEDGRAGEHRGGHGGRGSGGDQKFFGRPRPRRAMMFFWISEAPPPMVSMTVYR